MLFIKAPFHCSKLILKTHFDLVLQTAIRAKRPVELGRCQAQRMRSSAFRSLSQQHCHTHCCDCRTCLLAGFHFVPRVCFDAWAKVAAAVSFSPGERSGSCQRRNNRQCMHGSDTGCPVIVSVCNSVDLWTRTVKRIRGLPSSICASTMGDMSLTSVLSAESTRVLLRTHTSNRSEFCNHDL